MISSEFKIQDDILPDIINTTSNKNILLLYQKKVQVRELMLGFVLENLKNSRKSLIWICWNEPAGNVKKLIKSSGYKQDNIFFIDSISHNIEDEYTFLHTPNNYSGILMDIKKLIRNNEYVLVLDSLDIIESLGNKKGFVNFISTLSRMCTNSGGTLYSFAGIDILDFQTQKILQSRFDVFFNIRDDMIKIESDYYRWDIYYKIENNNIVVRRFPEMDVDNIEEIFNFSSEEKNNLDEIIKKQLYLNRDTSLS